MRAPSRAGLCTGMRPRGLGYLKRIAILESSYARIFEMSRQSQPPNAAEDHDDVPQAADLLKGAAERPLLNCVRAGDEFISLSSSRAGSPVHLHALAWPGYTCY